MDDLAKLYAATLQCDQRQRRDIVINPPINHFLLIYDIANGLAHVDEFQRDYDRALAAYAEAEARHRHDDNVEVVLLGSDSKDTLTRTHSSYFELAENHVDRRIARELAEFGLR